MRGCSKASACALLAATAALAFLGAAAGAGVQNATAEASSTLRLLFVGNSLLHYSGSAYKVRLVQIVSRLPHQHAYRWSHGVNSFHVSNMHPSDARRTGICMPVQVVAQLLEAQFPGTWVDSNEIWCAAMGCSCCAAHGRWRITSVRMQRTTYGQVNW